MKVRINVTVSNPPLEGLLNVLDWFSKILLQLASPRSNVIGHQDVCEGHKAIIVGSISSVSCSSQTRFALVTGCLFFTHQRFCILDPLLFPTMLAEVLKF